MDEDVANFTLFPSSFAESDDGEDDVVELPTRFKSATTEDVIVQLSTKSFAANTDRKILWAVDLFKSWHQHRIKTDLFYNFQISFCDVDDASKLVPGHLANCLCMFINEVKRKDGKEYEGKTLYDMVVCMQMHLEKQGRFLKLIDGDDFKKVKLTLDNLMKARTSARLASVGSAEPISVDLENEMWEKGVLGEGDPDTLQSTVMCLLGISCALRGGGAEKAALPRIQSASFVCKLSQVWETSCVHR